MPRLLSLCPEPVAYTDRPLPATTEYTKQLLEKEAAQHKRDLENLIWSIEQYERRHSGACTVTDEKRGMDWDEARQEWSR